MSGGDLALVVRRTLAAEPQLLFDAWTRAEHLVRWWGPAGVRCIGAEVDLRVGGAYRIGNLLPDGTAIWIAGRFEHVEPPRRLVYTWRTREDAPEERVTVRFEPVQRGSTEIVIVHERIATAAARRSHEGGWAGCLDGLGAALADGRLDVP